MLLSWTSSQVRAAEEPLLAAGVPLMDRAAFALAGRVAGLLRERRGRVGGARVLLLVGSGNNGGDTLFAGALLARRGAQVDAVAAGERLHDAGTAALTRAGGRIEQADDERTTALAAAADVVLDGLLGIGASGALRGRAAELVTAVREAGPAYVVAVDVPSGVGVDDGTLPGSVLHADLTVTFGAAKPGLLLPPACAAAGRVEVVDVGLSLAESDDGTSPDDAAVPAVARLGDDDVADLWPVPGPDAHKYTRGVVGIIAGARRYPGAAVLSTTAAVLAGVGMVRYLGDVADLVVARRPEVVPGVGRVQAWVFGPGVSPDDAAQRRRIGHAWEGVQQRGEAAVCDAGALELLPDRVGAHVVITPHAGELSTLLRTRGEHVDRAGVEAEPLRWARRVHELTGATVLLKGHVTIVVGAQGATYSQAEAPAWLSTAGSGDVLAGLLGSLLAGRADEIHDDPSVAAALAAAAALVHGRAAHRANPHGPVSARMVARALPDTIAALLTGRTATPRA